MAMVLALQAGLAAGLSWVAAPDLLSNPNRFFADLGGRHPGGVGRPAVPPTVELIIGVGIGVAVGDGPDLSARHRTLAAGAGGHPAILLTVFAGASVAIVIQAAATAAY
jgi:hypothetical protein